MSSITKLSKVDNRSSTYSVEDMLVAELEKVRSGERKGKCICIHLDTENDAYGIGYGSAGFNKMTEVIALIECLKVQIIAEDMELL